MSSMVADLQAALAKVGLQLQPSKCSIAKSFDCEVGEVFSGDTPIPRATNDVIRILGVLINANGMEQFDEDHKLSRSWAAFWRLRR
eukprot:5026354-Alexandrium_andersonii.AAC.1